MHCGYNMAMIFAKRSTDELTAKYFSSKKCAEKKCAKMTPQCGVVIHCEAMSGAVSGVVKTMRK
jgi:hypothetical protein